MATGKIENSGCPEVSYTYDSGWSDANTPRTKIRKHKAQVIAQIYGIYSGEIASGDSIKVLTIASSDKPFNNIQTMGVGLTSGEPKGAVIAQINSGGELYIINTTGAAISRIYVTVAYNIN